MAATSFFTGVSGLRNHQIRMDVIGNNIANVNTYGFKMGRATFADLLSLTYHGASAAKDGRGGINPMQVGMGMSTSAITNIMTQGTIENTGRLTDMAIEGNGFFVLENGEGTVYTRDGSFGLDANGTLVSANGWKVQGWTKTKETALGDTYIDTSTPIGNILFKLGDKLEAKETTLVAFRSNLKADSRSIVADGTDPNEGFAVKSDLLVDLYDNDVINPTHLGIKEGDWIEIHVKAIWDSVNGSDQNTMPYENEKFAYIQVTNDTDIGDLEKAIQNAIDALDTNGTLNCRVVFSPNEEKLGQFVIYNYNTEGTNDKNKLQVEVSAVSGSAIRRAYLLQDSTEPTLKGTSLVIGSGMVVPEAEKVKTLDYNISQVQLNYGNIVDGTLRLKAELVRGFEQQTGADLSGPDANGFRTLTPIHNQTDAPNNYWFGGGRAAIANSQIVRVNGTVWMPAPVDPATGRQVFSGYGTAKQEYKFDPETGIITFGDGGTGTAPLALRLETTAGGGNTGTGRFENITPRVGSNQIWTITFISDNEDVFTVVGSIAGAQATIGRVNEPYTTDNGELSFTVRGEPQQNDTLIINLTNSDDIIANENISQGPDPGQTWTITIGPNNTFTVEGSVSGLQINQGLVGTQYFTDNGELSFIVTGSPNEGDTFTITTVEGGGAIPDANDTIDLSFRPTQSIVRYLELCSLDSQGNYQNDGDYAVNLETGEISLLWKNAGADLDDPGVIPANPSIISALGASDSWINGLSGTVRLTAEYTTEDRRLTPPAEIMNSRWADYAQEITPIERQGSGKGRAEFNLVFAGTTEEPGFNGTVTDVSVNTDQASRETYKMRSGEVHRTSINVFDSQGNEHTLRVVFTHVGSSYSPVLGERYQNRWYWRAELPYEDVYAFDSMDLLDGTSSSTANKGSIEFTKNGLINTLKLQGNTGPVSFDPSPIDTRGNSMGNINKTSIQMIFDGAGNLLDGITQYASDFTASAYKQNGYAMGVLNTFSTDKSGTISGIYSNGVEKPIGQVAMAMFANPEGLLKKGDNLFAETVNSGTPVITRAFVNGAGMVHAAALEQSNVDLAQEFTNMIITQRGFQANARTITTSDEMLVELINMKR